MKDLYAKFLRQVARHTDKAVLPPLDASIISFSFDDCPKSAITNGLPLVEAEGWRSTIFVATALCETTNHLGLHMSEADIIDVHSRNHEIADHTFSHLSANDANVKDFVADVERNQQALTKLGLPRSRHFAYPYGHVSPALKRALSNKFQTLRGVVSSENPVQDGNLLNAMRVYSNDSIDLALSQIKEAKNTPQWLHLFTHDIRDTPSEFGCTIEDFKTIIAAVKDSALRVMTVDDAYHIITKTRPAL